jgi:large subunit ribosomal protein L21
MYAIVNIAGQQYKVEKDQKLFVHRLDEKEGESVSFDEVLLIDNDKSIVVGEPTINGAMISGKVISHLRGDKIKVFKKKRRKGYKVKTGHRQYLTEIQVEEIIEKGAVKASKATTTAKGKAPAIAKPAADSKEPAASATRTETAKSSSPPQEKKQESAAAKPAAKPKGKSVSSAEKTESKTASKKPAAKKTTATKTPAKKPAAAKPAAKKTAATKTPAKKPAAAKPAAKKPDAGEETKS